MTTEQYQIGYEDGYSAGWDAALAAPIAQPVKQSFQQLEYKVGWQRYEKVRKLNVHQFSELFQRGLKGERFDEMVDGLEVKP